MPEPGTCRHCGCHGDSCVGADGERCGWKDRSRSCCTAEPCMRAEGQRLRNGGSVMRRRKLSTADMHVLICGRKRKSKRKAERDEK